MFHLQQPATTCKTSLAFTLPRQSTHAKHAVANTSFPSVALCCMSSTCEVNRSLLMTSREEKHLLQGDAIFVLQINLDWNAHSFINVHLIFHRILDNMFPSKKYFHHFTMSSRHPPLHVISDQVAHLIKSQWLPHLDVPLVSAASALGSR